MQSPHITQRVLSILFKRLQKLSYLIIPNHCLFCMSLSENLLCAVCADTLQVNDHGCARCHLPLTLTLPTSPRQATLCKECGHTEPSFNQILCAYEYSHELGYLIQRFKEKKHLHIDSYLSAKLINDIRAHYADTQLPDYMVSVPLHWQSQLKRGFNQSEHIAGQLSKHLGIPVLKAVRKRKTDQQQKTLGRKERVKNMGDAFVLKPKAAKCIQTKYIAVIDDVVTTTATASCMASLLKNSGAHTVDIWALARTPKS